MNQDALRTELETSLKEIIEIQNGFVLGTVTEQERRKVFNKHLDFIVSKLSTLEAAARREERERILSQLPKRTFSSEYNKAIDNIEDSINSLTQETKETEKE